MASRWWLVIAFGVSGILSSCGGDSSSSENCTESEGAALLLMSQSTLSNAQEAAGFGARSIGYVQSGVFLAEVNQAETDLRAFDWPECAAHLQPKVEESIEVMRDIGDRVNSGEANVDVGPPLTESQARLNEAITEIVSLVGE